MTNQLLRKYNVKGNNKAIRTYQSPMTAWES